MILIKCVVVLAILTFGQVASEKVENFFCPSALQIEQSACEDHLDVVHRANIDKIGDFGSASDTTCNGYHISGCRTGGLVEGKLYIRTAKKRAQKTVAGRQFFDYRHMNMLMDFEFDMLLGGRFPFTIPGRFTLALKETFPFVWLRHTHTSIPLDYSAEVSQFRTPQNRANTTIKIESASFLPMLTFRLDQWFAEGEDSRIDELMYAAIARWGVIIDGSVTETGMEKGIQMYKLDHFDEREREPILGFRAIVRDGQTSLLARIRGELLPTRHIFEPYLLLNENARPATNDSTPQPAHMNEDL